MIDDRLIGVRRHTDVRTYIDLHQEGRLETPGTGENIVRLLLGSQTRVQDSRRVGTQDTQGKGDKALENTSGVKDSIKTRDIEQSKIGTTGGSKREYLEHVSRFRE